MALANNKSFTELFGAHCTLTGIAGDAPSANPKKVNIVIAEQGIATDLNEGPGGTNVTFPDDITPEGFLLALLQQVNVSQGDNTARRLTVDKLTPTITTRGGETVRTERYTVTFYTNESASNLDPDTI